MMRMVSWLGKWRRDEEGSLSFALFMVCLLTLLGGVALDTSNAWKHKQLLQQTADAASHAGAVALQRGATDESVRTQVIEMVEANIDLDSYGPVLVAERDIEILDYNIDAKTLSASTTNRNAVAVTLHRDDSVENPVELLMLRVLSVFSPDEVLGPWNVAARSIATTGPSSACSGTDTIYAQGEINLTANQYFGSGYCVHSQENVWMPQGTTFEPNTVVSMPDLSTCGNKCTNSANPGAGDAARELNTVSEDIAGYVTTTGEQFLSGEGQVAESFFEDRPVKGDQSSLQPYGVTGGATSGQVIRISAGDFNNIDTPPEGLTYDVSCSGAYENRVAKKNDKSIDMNGTYRNLAIVTDCPILMGRSVEMYGAMVVVDDPGVRISAQSHASVGDSTGSCDAAGRSTIMSLGELRVPAAFATSNITLVSGSDMQLAGGGPPGGAHYGLSLIAAGEIHISSHHTFMPCAKEPEMTAKLSLIRHVELPVE